MESFKELLKEPVLKEIIANNGEIFFVGGCVRDSLLNLPRKDIDIVVRNLKLEEILNIIKPFGRVEVVGESFSILIFKSHEGLQLDIALPRIDSKGEITEGKNAHTAIIAQSDPFMKIEEDLGRRDFTINSMAINQEGKLIDPFDGEKDLKAKVLQATNLKAFSDDPLRILRALRFALRFGLEIDVQVEQMIKKNKKDLENIPTERIYDELTKIVETKIKISSFYKLIKHLELSEEFFGVKNVSEFSLHNLITATTVSELLFALDIDDIANKMKERMKMPIHCFKELVALEKLKQSHGGNAKRQFFDCLQIWPDLLYSEYVNKNAYFKSISEEFISGGLPKNKKEMKINGKYLLELGYPANEEMGKVLDSVLNAILECRIENKQYQKEILEKIK